MKLTLVTGEVLDNIGTTPEDVKAAGELACEVIKCYGKRFVSEALPKIQGKKQRHRQARNEKFPNACKSWSQADDDDITDGLRDGLIVEQLAKNMGRTAASVHSRIRYLGLTVAKRRLFKITTG